MSSQGILPRTLSLTRAWSREADAVEVALKGPIREGRWVDGIRRGPRWVAMASVGEQVRVDSAWTCLAAMLAVGQVRRALSQPRGAGRGAQAPSRPIWAMHALPSLLECIAVAHSVGAKWP